jgi:Coenzyme PQQ synthesis protein D (PqqD)
MLEDIVTGAAQATAVKEVDRQDAALDARGRVPANVVYRDFVNETVALNLNTGTYHGLNPTAGRMLQAVERADTLREAAARLAEDNGWDLPTVETDLVELCRTLAESGLIELEDGGTT